MLYRRPFASEYAAIQPGIRRGLESRRESLDQAEQRLTDAQDALEREVAERATRESARQP